MARKMTKAQSKGSGLLALVVLSFAGIAKFFETVGWVIPVLTVLAGIAAYFWYQHDKQQKRLQYLRSKYSSEEVVQDIFQGRFWQGQTEDQLKDALGAPSEVDNKVLKTKTRQVWKYQPRGGNRFGLRITVEDGYVTGWEKKS